MHGPHHPSPQFEQLTQASRRRRLLGYALGVFAWAVALSIAGWLFASHRVLEVTFGVFLLGFAFGLLALTTMRWLRIREERRAR